MTNSSTDMDHRVAWIAAIQLTLVAMASVGLSLYAASDEDGNGDYPTRPIKLVVPFSAGGGTDTFARIIKQAVEEHKLLPQPLVIINQGGAGATIGSRRVKDADPDGYTLLILHEAILTAKYSKKVKYGPEAFEAVAGTGEIGMVITVNKDAPYQDLRELMEAAKQQPDHLKFGANLGAMTHFAGLQLERLHPGARFRFAQIGGGADRFADLKGGHIDVTGFSIEEFARFRSEGLRGLAYFGAERHGSAPSVPTAVEQGYDLVSTNVFYWWFPKGTPREHCQVVADALKQAMETEQVKRRMADIHCEPVYLEGDALRERLAVSTESVAHVAPGKDDALRHLPYILIGSTLVLGAVCLVISLREWGRHPLPKMRHKTPNGKSGPGNSPLVVVLAASALTIVYVVVLSLTIVDFRFVTAPYVLLLSACLLRHRILIPPILLLALNTAAIAGFGIHFMLTQVFVVDLP